jgi:hypothetical protein
MSLGEQMISRGVYPVTYFLSRVAMKGWQKVSDKQPLFLFKGAPPELDSSHIMPGALLFADRISMLKLLPKGKVGAEIGTYKGVFARALLDHAAPAKLYLLDRDFSLVPGDLLAKEIEAGVVEQKVGDSSTSMAAFPPDFFDWIYVDGDHRLEGVTRDVMASHRALKPGGLMMFNDYIIFDAVSGTPFGVIHAVNGLCVDHGYKVVGFALHRDGYSDILLKKPD